MERTGYIGGSDIGAILGVDRFRTPLDVWREKVGEVLPFEGNADTERGLKLEPVAAREYTERTGIKLRRVNAQIVHPDHAWARGRVDRLTQGLDRNEIREIKCPRLGAFAKWKREGLDESKIAQLGWYLGIWNTKAITPAAEWIVFCADLWEMLPVRVEFDPTLFVEMLKRAGHFWFEHVEKRVPPTQAQADELKLDIEKAGGQPVVKREDVEFSNALTLLREAKELSAEAEVLEAQAKERLAELIEKKPGVYVAPGARLSYTMAQGKSTFAKDSLKASRPLDRIKVGTLLQPYLTSGALPEGVIAEVGKCDLDFAPFEGRGKPYPVMKPTFYSAD